MNKLLPHTKAVITVLHLALLPLSSLQASPQILSNDPADSQKLEYLELINKISESPTDPAISDNPAEPASAPSTSHTPQHSPAQLESMLRKALNQHNPEQIQSLADAYSKLPDADPLLIKRAEGSILRHRHQYREAIKIYEELSREYPDNQGVRFDLATLQLNNKQWKDAAENFDLIAASENLSSNMSRNIEPYRAELKDRKSPQWVTRFGLEHNSNIDDVPIQYCSPDSTCIGIKPETAVGFDYHIGVSKLTPLRGNHSVLFRSTLNGTSYYFDNKSQYDNASGRVYAGWQWQDWRHTLTVLPFYQARFSGSEDFRSKPEKKRRIFPYMASHSVGTQIKLTKALSPKWQSQLSIEGYHQNYRDHRRARRYDGWRSNTFASLTYRASRETSLSADIQHSRLIPKNRFRSSGRENNSAYHRNKIGLNWRQKWNQPAGLESNLSVSHSRTRYRGTPSSSFMAAQKNREWSASLALSHKKLVFAGFEPNLNIQYRRTHSNLQSSNKKLMQFFIEAERRF